MKSIKTIFEPFRIKMVEPLPMLDKTQRQEWIKKCHYNLFTLPADKVTFDFLTDSGTSAMSSQQWAGMMLGDESYAGSKSYEHFAETIYDLTGLEHVIPTHQGRSAEALLCKSLLKPGQHILGNTHFDTTRANIESNGGVAIDLPSAESVDSQNQFAFKGNVHLENLAHYIELNKNKVCLFIMTVTNNSIGGQPVSMQNIRRAKEIVSRYQIPFFIDAARFAENAFFIKTKEDGYAHKTVKQIAQEMMSYADGVLMSAKKDAFANIGGFLAVKDSVLAAQIRQDMVITEGFPTYGGLSGRDLEAVAFGLKEIVNEDYLNYRIASVKYFGQGLESAGFKMVQPYGGHAIYIDAEKTVPQIPKNEFPAQSLAISLYEEIGIRGVEVGSLMFGHYDAHSKTEVLANKELVRLAIPRRVYTQSHIDYIIESVQENLKDLSHLQGYQITEQPKFLRHFTAKLKPITQT